MREAFLRLVRRSTSLTIPIIAHWMILWGVIYLAQGETRRRRSPGLSITVELLPPWAWCLLFILSGLSFLVFVKPWAVAVMVATLTFYATTQLINVLTNPATSLTAPGWPMCAALVCVATGARVGARRPADVPGG